MISVSLYNLPVSVFGAAGITGKGLPVPHHWNRMTVPKAGMQLS